jgi:hypothetical protein
MKDKRQFMPPSLRTKLWSFFLMAAPAIATQGCLFGGNDGWINIGPEGGSIRQLAVDPQNPGIIYAATGTGVLKSRDGGSSWNNVGLNGFAVVALVIDPQKPTTLYAFQEHRWR